MGELGFGETPVEPEFWFKEASLYHTESYDFEDSNYIGFKKKRENLLAVIFPKISIDSYCTSCNRETVFTPSVRQIDWADDERKPTINNGVQHAMFNCSRKHCRSVLTFVFLIENGSQVTKIGQSPSIADLLTPELRKYSKVLGDGLISDWQRAVGLRAHGIGAGSYVYLRRIIESLVTSAAQEAIAAEDIDEDTFRKARWPERIKMLASHLPDYLVDNSQVYGVLSSGVHELSEDECNNYFDVLHTAIEIICEENLAERSRRLKAEAGAKALQKIKQQLAEKGSS